ncbi:MAG: hypothetical protein EXS38_06275 [Opitutus sp.]|nr:hypothetical protein [Opitutus sp.]
MVTLIATVARAAAPVAPPPQLAQLGLPDAAEARRILEQFRHAGVAGSYFFQFELHQLPRRGEEQVFRGRLWGAQNEQGAITRVVLTDAAGREHRLLVQNGTQAAVWRCTGGPVVQLGVTALFEPVVPGVLLTAFDLQMPFLFWPDAAVVSIKRILGRPANEFIFRPPPAFAAQHPELTAVRSYFDTQANAPTQTELIGRDGRVTKLFSLIELKRIGGQTIPKSLDWRDEISRNKTRLLVTGVALELDLPPAFFAPAALAEDVRPPAGDRIVRIAP